MGALRNLFNAGSPWAPAAFRNWGEAASDKVDLLDENAVLQDDTRLTDARTPTVHGNDHHSAEFVATTDSRLSDSRVPVVHDNELHSVNYVAGVGITKVMSVTEANYPANPETDVLYVVFSG